MNSQRKYPDGSPYWTKLRLEIIQWLDDHAPSFTDGYIAAVQLLHMPSFPVKVHLICHMVRDFYRYLPSALGIKSSSRPGEIFPGMAQALAQQWDRHANSQPPTPDGVDPYVMIHDQVHKSMIKIVDKWKELEEQPKVGALLAIALHRTKDSPESESIPPWVLDAFHKEYKFFVKRAHLAIEVDDVPTEDGLEDHFQAFERAFHSLVGQYFSGKEELDDILQETNTTSN